MTFRERFLNVINGKMRIGLKYVQFHKSRVGFTAWIKNLLNTTSIGYYGLDYLIFDAVDCISGSPKWEIPILADEPAPDPLPRYWQ